jgi:hypothetical protein
MARSLLLTIPSQLGWPACSDQVAARVLAGLDVMVTSWLQCPYWGLSFRPAASAAGGGSARDCGGPVRCAALRCAAGLQGPGVGMDAFVSSSEGNPSMMQQGCQQQPAGTERA